MTSSKFIAHQERRIRRRFTASEVTCIELARAACMTGKRDKVKAMLAVLAECLPIADYAKVQRLDA